MSSSGGGNRNARSDAERAQTNLFNTEQVEMDRIFGKAEELSGNLADNLDFDLDSLRFTQSQVLKGRDDREGHLNALVEGLKQRRQSIQQQQSAPGGSQTRLSLLDN